MSIYLDGYFERKEYFADHQANLRKWFSVATTESLLSRAEDVVIHMARVAEFGSESWILPSSYYTSLLAAMTGVGKVFVCGLADSVAREDLKPWNPVYVDGDVVEQFALMTKASRLILSNSTVAWWASFLSAASEVYGPRAVNGNGYAFGGYRDVDLEPKSLAYRGVPIQAFARVGWTVESGSIEKAVLFEDGVDATVYPVAGMATRIKGGSQAMALLRKLALGKSVHFDYKSGDLARNDMRFVIGALASSGLARLRQVCREPEAKL